MKSDSFSSPSAQSQLYELLNCKEETRKLILSVGSLLEECLPEASVWIIKTEDSESGAESVYRAGKGSGIEARLSELDPFVKKIHHDTRISDIASHLAGTELLALFPEHEFTSATIHRIRPRNSHAWGYIFVLFRLGDKNQREVEQALTQGELWVQFATTILERRVLEERLQMVEARLDLAMKASGLGIFDWDINSNQVFWTPQTYLIHGVTPESFQPSSPKT